MDVSDKDTERVAAVLPLTRAVFHILLVLAERARHGYGIMQEVERLTDGRVTLGPGTLYRSLQRLRAEGLIEEVGGPADEPVEDDRRRTYGLTDAGLAIARAEAARLAALVRVARARGLLAPAGRRR